MMQTKLPIGIENFEKLRTQDFYYVDKTGLIKTLLENWGEVNLFTRPRRFGKSLNMNMLQSFFEYGCNPDLFEGLQISQEKKICEAYMGKFPVLAISLKGVSGNSFESAIEMFKYIIGDEALRLEDLQKSEKLSPEDKALYRQLLTMNKSGYAMTEETLANSLKTLSRLLYKHYGQKVIILIDEYDVPLDKAYQYGYYDQMVGLIRSMFNQSLKSNEALFFAVLTGCLRVSKESIFTGLNNLQIFSITDARFDEYFGFVDDEVKALLKCYGLSDHYQAIRDWYDGYRFGTSDVYCPWDVINYVAELRANPLIQPKDYWVNTSGNDIVRMLIEKAGNSTTKREIEQLIAGETIIKEIKQELTYKEINQSIDNLWSVLFTTGYLTQVGMSDGDLYKLRIPNLEIRKIFTRQIYTWFKETAGKDGQALQIFCEAIRKGDIQDVEASFNQYLMKTISIRDTFVRKKQKENFYHGILLGLLAYKDDWIVSSNRESGEGYSDILVEIEAENTGIIIEVKYPDNDDLEAGCVKALEQIEHKDYEAMFRENGIQKILKYGIACCRKHCKVACEQDG